MLRAFVVTTRKLLVPRPLPVHTLTADAASSSTAIYDVRRNRRISEHDRLVLPSGLLPCTRLPLLGQNTFLLSNIRYKSTGFKVPDPALMVCNMINMLKCVDLTHMKDAPAPSFWFAVAISGTQVVIPLLEIIGGYCPVLTFFQLHLAALTVAYFGGLKWGLALSKNPVPQPTYDIAKSVATPTIIALVGLLLPYPLGYLTVAGAMVSVLYLDLKSCVFPPWANATRLLLTVTTVAGLLMALIAYLLFHGKQIQEKKKEEKKEKKKEKKKEEMVIEEEEEEEEEEEREQDDDKKESKKDKKKEKKDKKKWD